MITKFAAGLAAAMLLSSSALAAVANGPVAAAPAAQRFRIGSLRVIALKDADYVAANDGQTFGVDAGPAAVAQALAKAGAPTDRITVSVNALLVQTPGRMSLLDTGLGARAKGVLQASLAEAGIKPAQITDILLTHAHGDHIGGVATKAGELAFPNATIRMSAKEWAALQGEPGAAKLVKLIAPKVKTFEPGTAVVPGITPIALYGHTPGHVGYEIEFGAMRLFDLGDSAHSSLISLSKPAWTMGFDADPGLGRTSREATLAGLAKSQELVFSPHFPFPGVGRIEAAGEGYAWKAEQP